LAATFQRSRSISASGSTGSKQGCINLQFIGRALWSRHIRVLLWCTHGESGVRCVELHACDRFSCFASNLPLSQRYESRGFVEILVYYGTHCLALGTISHCCAETLVSVTVATLTCPSNRPCYLLGCDQWTGYCPIWEPGLLASCFMAWVLA
jgi:hypothetical protein